MIKSILIIIFIELSFLSYSENLVLSNGEIYKGQVVYLNKYKIFLKTNKNILEIPMYKIEYLLFDYTKNKNIILNLITINGKSKKVNLLKLTKNILYYLDNNYNNLKHINTSQILDFYIDNTYNIVINAKKYYSKNYYYKDLNIDLDIFIDNLYNFKKKSKQFIGITKEEILSFSRSNIINIENEDYYEKFWERINKYINPNTKNLIWDLLEKYLDKEKYLNYMYNEKNQIPLLDNEEKMVDRLKIEVINLRKEFYYRAKKIIMITEYLVHDN